MSRVWLALVTGAAAAGLAGCSKPKGPPPPPPPARVGVVRPASVPVRDFWTYNGYLEATKTVEVRSKIRGFLTDVRFAEGSEVKAGDPLYEIDKLEYQTAYTKAEAELEKAEADILKAAADVKNWEAQIVEAKIEWDRVKRSIAGGGDSETNLVKAQATHDTRVAEREAAKANREAAKANRDAAKAALHSADIMLGYTEIRAKIGGRISRTLVDAGNLVLADTTLLTTINKVDELFVYFDAPEPDLLALQQAILASQHRDPTSRQIPVEVGVGKEDGFPHVGKIDFRDNRVESATGTIRIRGRIPNPSLDANNTRLLFPGMYARVRVPKADESAQLVIPEDCLLNAQEGRFVYVIGADKKVQKRFVTLGATVWKAPPAVPGAAPPGWVAVNPNPAPPADGQPPANTRRPVRSVVAVAFHEPLRADERVTIDGIQRLKPGDPVDPEEWTLTPPADAPKK